MITSELAERGIRLTLDAEELLKGRDNDQQLMNQLLLLNKPLIVKEDIQNLTPKTEVVSATHFSPLAKEYSSNIKVHEARDVTGKSRTKGEVDNFIAHFRDRYSRLSKLLYRVGTTSVDLGDLRKKIGEKVRVTVLVSDKSETKKGNILIEVEDMTGTFKVVISNNQNNEKLLAKARGLLKDDVVAITGKVLEPYIIAEDLEWPDLPVIREKKFTETDLAIAYLSDLHFGSRYFLDKKLKLFSEWLHGRGEAKDLASKVKYVIIAGDVVDGIGVYPNQEKELTVKNIGQQYQMADDFLEDLPDHIDVIVAPGNHDAVRRGEPQPALPKDLLKSDVVRIGNPSVVTIENIKHLIYHGTASDSMIANVPGLSYKHPENVMIEHLKRRHLSPLYGGNLIVPENIDYMVIEDVPDIFHSGHVHKNGYASYRGTLVINSGTFQDQTDFQIKQGHIPTPALVPVYETKYGRLRTLDFNQ